MTDLSSLHWLILFLGSSCNVPGLVGRALQELLLLFLLCVDCGVNYLEGGDRKIENSYM